MSHPVPAEESCERVSPLEAFAGELPPSRTSVFYQLGLVVVALAMVLLPVLYIALIVLAIWGVVWHLGHDTWMMEGAAGRGALLRLIVYLGPAAAGVILIFFMVKPFFAKRSKQPESVALDPETEPLLFAFVARICGLVGASVPVRIHVDCEVNASASLRRGIWSRDLVLTIGLPLAAGLEMRQFAGVLAHEFGHFAQGAGMRLTYVIRHINMWFARVVYERDAWDVQLDSLARGTDLRIGIVLHAARGCVWLTRRILWALMHAGHAISCFMLRQMEYDADRYEARLAGVDIFESTAMRLRFLNVATQVAYENVRQTWASRRLPEDLPLLIGHKAASLPPEVWQRISSETKSTRTRWIDTHPCDADRIASVRRENAPGIFHVTAPARDLFADFPALCKSVTVHQYRENLELDFAESDLMSAEEIVRESAATDQATAAIRHFYGDISILIEPLLVPADESTGPDQPDQPALSSGAWEEARSEMAARLVDAKAAAQRCGVQLERMAQCESVVALARAGFRLEPKSFGLPDYATSLNEQEVAARTAIDAARSEFETSCQSVRKWMEPLRRRVRLALAQASDAERQEAVGLAPLLEAMGAEMAPVTKIGIKLPSLIAVARNRDNHSDVLQVDRVLEEIGRSLSSTTEGVGLRLRRWAYPFPHPHNPASVEEYLTAKEPGTTQWHRSYLAADACYDRWSALHARLLGRILVIAQDGEKRAGWIDAGSNDSAVPAGT